MFKGAHCFEDHDSHRENPVELMASWIKERS